MSRPDISTYFSHSYRLEDQAANKAIWERFARHGFFFTVDPPTELSSHTHLETMMFRSSCFVALVNYRRENQPLFYSRFVGAEIGLAVHSRTPKLILLDDEIPRERRNELSKGLSRDEHLPIQLNAPEDYAEDLDFLIQKLARRALRASRRRRARPRNSLALLVPDKGSERAYGGRRARDEIVQSAQLHGMSCTEVRVPHRHDTAFTLLLDQFECIAVDVRGEVVPGWMFAYLYGRFIPTIKLVRLEPAELASSVSLPPLVRGLQMDPDEPGVESLIYWRDRPDLVFQMSRVLERITTRGTELRNEDEGLAYFDSIGRRPARLFVSNAGSANDFADALCSMLQRHNIQTWQYKQRGAIRSGAKWPEVVKQQLEICDVFVALLDRAYPESDWCRREMKRARERAAAGQLALLPFQIDPRMPGSEIEKLIGELQAPPVHQAGDDAYRRVFEAVDEHLKGIDHGDWRQSQPALAGASREAIVDALRHLSRTKYDRLLGRLKTAGITPSVTPRRSAPQPRQAAEQLLHEVQQSSDVPSGAHAYGSTASLLVATLADLVDGERQRVLKGILKRIESKMKLRRG